MSAVEFRPNDFQIRIHNQTTETHLVFGRDTGERMTVVLQRNQVPQVLLELQKQIAPGSGVPINLSSFRAGGTFAVAGIGYGPRSDHFVLTVFVDLPDQGRGVTVPLRLSKKDVEECVKAMTKWLGPQAEG